MNHCPPWTTKHSADILLDKLIPGARVADCLLGTDDVANAELYPPVVITAEALYSRPSSPLPLIDPTLLLRPIAPDASPMTGTMLAVVSPNHLPHRRTSGNASPSVNSWAGSEHNHYYLSPCHHQSQRPSNLHGSLPLKSGPNLLSEPNMMRLAPPTRSDTNGANGVVLTNRGPANQQRGLRNASPVGRWCPATSAGENNRSREQVTANNGVVYDDPQLCSLTNKQRHRADEEQVVEGEHNTGQEHFLDNLNISELFLLGSLSQQNLVGKQPPPIFVTSECVRATLYRCPVTFSLCVPTYRPTFVYNRPAPLCQFNCSPVALHPQVGTLQ